MTARRLLIYGVPGVGKSTLATSLARKADLSNIALDSLRSTAQEYLPGAWPDPFLSEYTTNAWRQFGDLTPETAVRGFLAVRGAFGSLVLAALRGEDRFVAESAIVDPAAASILAATAALLIEPHESTHYERFFVHRAPGAEADEQFRAARYVQQHLVLEATQLNVRIVDSSSSFEL